LHLTKPFTDAVLVSARLPCRVAGLVNGALTL